MYFMNHILLYIPNGKPSSYVVLAVLVDFHTHNNISQDSNKKCQ